MIDFLRARERIDAPHLNPSLQQFLFAGQAGGPSRAGFIQEDPYRRWIPTIGQSGTVKELCQHVGLEIEWTTFSFLLVNSSQCQSGGKRAGADTDAGRGF